ncbi:MAG TPA: pirin-like C-terminal cupin domain-containing protein [Burkholderiaceae bacterium]|nr:pirin-like C-terminal cupin domain-containing protein [Burkholderiaceae bacterium]
MTRSIKTFISMPWHAFDAASGAYMLHPRDLHLLDPFIGVDAFTMPQPYFPPHPHAGMSAVTLMFDDAEGGFINRDSLGDRSEIRPGDLHWTQAGSGMIHEEIPSEPGRAARGLQVFVNMARAHKQAPPAAFHIRREAMPTLQAEGMQGTVMAGELRWQGAVLRSPITQDARWLTQGDMIDLRLVAGARVEFEVDAAKNAFFVLMQGELAIEGRTLPAPGALVFEQDGNTLALQAGAAGARGVLLAGRPIGEPIYPKGPFMGNSAEDIAVYATRFYRGDMGSLAASF